ncbi:MAG: amino acid permease [Gemmatimonadales bacterium]
MPPAPDRITGTDQLVRRIGGLSAAGVLVGTVIGSGIFRVPSIVMSEVGSIGGAALVWLVGAGVTLCGAIPLAGLSAAFPRAGGIYAFLREAYGPLPAFLFGWIKLLVTGPSAVAAIALIFATYARTFVALSDWGVQLVAAGLIVVLAAANILSVPWTAAIQNVSALTKTLGLVALAVLLFGFGGGDGALNEPIRFFGEWGGFWVALLPVLWTYTGWADFTYLAGEVRDPARNYPRVMLGGLGVVVVLYLLANAAYLYVLPMEQVSGSEVVAAAAAERVFGAVGGSLVALLVMISTLGSLNGSILANPRVFYAMAQDGLFFRRVAAVHPRSRTPYVALLVYMTMGLLGVATRTFEQLAQIFVLGIWPFYALTVGAVFLRKTWPTSGPIRGAGYPFLPALFLLVSIAMLVSGLVERPMESAISLGILILGIPVYFAWRAVRHRWETRSVDAAARGSR